MRVAGKRRGMDVPRQNKIKSIWLGTWQVVYFLVSMLTYITAIVGSIMSTYYVMFKFEPMKALMAGLLVLLMMQFNRMNP